MISDFSFVMQDDKAIVSFKSEVLNQEYDLEVHLLPSKNIKGTEIQWLGVPIINNEQYSVVSFRIEMNADSITLMRPNLWMEGNTVLSVGIQMNDSREVIYFQTVVEISMSAHQQTYLMAVAERDDEEHEDIHKLRERYYRLKEDCEETTHTFNVVGESVELGGTTPENNDLFSSDVLPEEVTPCAVILPDLVDPVGDPLIPNIGDAIYFSGETNVWKEGVTSNGLQIYRYITYLFAGTENRETHIVILDWVKGGSASSQVWYQQLAFYRQECVMYNVYNGHLGFSEICTPSIKVKNAKVEIEVENKNAGVFWKLKRNAEMQGTFLNKVVECVITWIPYLSEVASNYEVWTDEDESMERVWHNTLQAQRDAYDNKLIQALSAEASKLKVVDDLIYIEVTGSGVTGVEFKYSFTVED